MILNSQKREIPGPTAVTMGHYPEPFTTNIKTIDCSKAVKDLKHDPKVTPEEGIRRTVEWMKWYYRIGD